MIEFIFADEDQDFILTVSETHLTLYQFKK